MVRAWWGYGENLVRAWCESTEKRGKEGGRGEEGGRVPSGEALTPLRERLAAARGRRPRHLLAGPGGCATGRCSRRDPWPPEDEVHAEAAMLVVTERRPWVINHQPPSRPHKVNSDLIGTIQQAYLAMRVHLNPCSNGRYRPIRTVGQILRRESTGHKLVRDLVNVDSR